MVLPGSAQLSEDQQGTFFQAVLDRSLTAEAKAGAIERHFGSRLSESESERLADLLAKAMR